MKTLIILPLLAFLISCSNTEDSKSVSIKKKIKEPLTNKVKKLETKKVPFEKTEYTDQYYISSLKSEFKEFTYYKLTDTIIQDLTGDNLPEKIYLTKNKKTSGITIIDGLNSKETKIGYGKDDGVFFDEFNWVDYWAITNDKETNEVVVKDNELVNSITTKLKTSGIVLRDDEAGGGIIIYDNGKYRWIHQSC